MNQHALGWNRDTPDFRDHKVGQQMRFSAPPVLPPSVDLASGFGPCYDQGDLGSCTGNAIAAALEFDRRKERLPLWTPSRMFIYYVERVMEGTINIDAGAQIRDGIKCVAGQGAPPEWLWPYDLKKWRTKPSNIAVHEAQKHPALEYAAVGQTLSELQDVLAAGYPVIFGFSVYESFEAQGAGSVTQTGNAPMPSPSERLLGGHAIVLKGYDNATKRFGARNSWGTAWGQKGYFTLPYDYVLNPDLASDFWVVRHTQ